MQSEKSCNGAKKRKIPKAEENKQGTNAIKCITIFSKLKASLHFYNLEVLSLFDLTSTKKIHKTSICTILKF